MCVWGGAKGSKEELPSSGLLTVPQEQVLPSSLNASSVSTEARWNPSTIAPQTSASVRFSPEEGASHPFGHPQ